MPLSETPSFKPHLRQDRPRQTWNCGQWSPRHGWTRGRRAQPTSACSSISPLRNGKELNRVVGSGMRIAAGMALTLLIVAVVPTRGAHARGACPAGAARAVATGCRSWRAAEQDHLSIARLASVVIITPLTYRRSV